MYHRYVYLKASLSIFKLREWGYLSGHETGTIYWEKDGHEDAVCIRVEYSSGVPVRIKLIYTAHLEEDTDIGCWADIDSTHCNYGGERYWFKCPGRSCGRRVAKLHYSNGYFVCRHCHKLVYSSQYRYYSRRLIHIGRIWDLERKECQIRYKYWKGRPTKRYQKILNKWDKQ